MFRVNSGGDVPNDGGQCFDVHAVFQGDGGKGVPQIMKSDSFTRRSRMIWSRFRYIASDRWAAPAWSGMGTSSQRRCLSCTPAGSSTIRAAGWWSGRQPWSWARWWSAFHPPGGPACWSAVSPVFSFRSLPSESQDSPPAQARSQLQQEQLIHPSLSLAWSRNRWISSPERIFISFCSAAAAYCTVCQIVRTAQKAPVGKDRNFKPEWRSVSGATQFQVGCTGSCRNGT